MRCAARWEVLSRGAPRCHAFVAMSYHRLQDACEVGDEGLARVDDARRSGQRRCVV